MRMSDWSSDVCSADLDLTLFRDDRRVALHDLVEACRSSARHCLLAAELMPNDPRCEELRALGGKRTATADFFGERMIAEDDIPGGPPEERSLVETVLARARAAFADEAMDARPIGRASGWGRVCKDVSNRVVAVH